MTETLGGIELQASSGSDLLSEAEEADQCFPQLSDDEGISHSLHDSTVQLMTASTWKDLGGGAVRGGQSS